MHFLYTSSIYLYALLIRIASLFNPKAKQFLQGRKNQFKNIPHLTQAEVYWFHCASLGEFDQALPVINAIKVKNPSVYIVATFFSPSGYLHYHKRTHLCDFVCYLPLDTPKNAKKFIAQIRPKKIFFVKYEFWANYIFEAKRQHIKIYSISTLFRPKQLFFKKGFSFFTSILKQFDFFFVQNSQSADLLKSVGIHNFEVTGDTRYDRVIENKRSLILNPKIENFLDGRRAIIFGSTWPADEEVLIPLIAQIQKDYKVIIAPHDISEKHILQIEKLLDLPYTRFSTYEPTNDQTQLMILDTIGNLASAYYYADIAYVGGGFSGNLHNILEPAVFGIPVIFGPKYKRFPEAFDFINRGIGFSINASDNFITSYEQIRLHLEQLKAACQHTIEFNQGATKKIIELI